MTFVKNAISNNMLGIKESTEKKKYLLELIKTITCKTYEEPHIVNLLFTNNPKGGKKGTYVPLEVLILMLKHEQMDEDSEIKELLREAILVHMKHPSFSILKYLVEDSYICEILVNKLAIYFDMLPRELEMKKFHSSTFPSEE